MRVAITGGAGFIGTNTVRALLRAGEEVVVVDDLSSGTATNLSGLDLTLHTGTILDPPLLDMALAAADAVIHLAAVASVPRSIDDPVGTHTVNASGTLEVLEAARRQQVGHVVLASSSAVYGSAAALPQHEGLRPEPLSPYAVSKLAAEAYALAYARCFGLEVLPLRFFNVFGPLQPADHAYAAAVPAFVDAALAGRPVQLYGDGGQTRDFTFVGGVADLLVRAVRERISSPQPVNLASGTHASLIELLALIGRILGREVEVERRPVREGDVRHSRADITRLRELFGDPRPVALEDGLRETVEWLRRHRSSSGS